jgi:UPF0755 protein
MKRFISLLIVIFIALFLLGILWLFQELDYTSPIKKIIYFKQGTSLRQMAARLEKEKVIPHARFLEIVARLQKKDKLIKAGEYEFQKGLKPLEVLDILVQGKVKQYSLTIPEGFNLEQIGREMIKLKITNPSEWDALIHSPELISLSGIKTTSLEGYLFPDTYLTEKQTTAIHLVKQMIELFKKKISSLNLDSMKPKTLPLHQIVTLASIVEKETGMASERKLIASVFINRLAKNMLLQSDPTVIYGLNNFDGNLTKKHLETDTPYNTYTRAGLPPGPICSPGLESLRAVIKPARTRFLYFVAKGDGSHHFSETLEEHNEAVRRYQLKRK